MNFNFNNKIIFIDSFQFLSSSIHRLVKNLGKDDFKYLSQEGDSLVMMQLSKSNFISDCV